MKIGAHFLPEDFPVFMESLETAAQAATYTVVTAWSW